jgi:16S rRNA (cytosine967-C5)-methyltransferase
MLTATIPRQTVRQLALEVLCRGETSGAFADQSITSLAAARNLPSQARAFLRELTYGVLRWRNQIDWMLGFSSHRPLARLTPTVRNLLRLGVYQLHFMDRIPSYAAVSETVRLAKQVSHGGVASYVNAVLRAVDRQRGRRLLPTPEDDLLAYLTITQSHPSWLVERWIACYGSEQAMAMCRANNLRPPLVVRANRLRISPERLLASLTADGCAPSPCRYAPAGIAIASSAPLEELQGFRQGWFAVQDEAAILCGYLLAPRPGERILDACAAPGGKASHVAELMADRGEILCLDHSHERMQRVEANARRLGLNSLRYLVGDAGKIVFERSFDRVLLDAPCTGLGVLRRHPDAKWLKGPASIDIMARQQRALLEHLSRFVKPEGIILYVTCSTEPEENQAIVHGFLEDHSHYALETVANDVPEAARVFVGPEGWLQTRPGPDGLDGFFAARLRRRH